MVDAVISIDNTVITFLNLAQEENEYFADNSVHSVRSYHRQAIAKNKLIEEIALISKRNGKFWLSDTLHIYYCI